VALGSEEHLNVLLGGVEDGGEVAGCHFDGFGAVQTGLYRRVVVMRADELLMEGTSHDIHLSGS
jgi:hypothetical protein